MKIGIITFHCARSYGAVLQTAALYQKLSELSNSAEVYIIDYCPKSIKQSFLYKKIQKNNPLINLLRLLYSVVQLPFTIEAIYKLNLFRRKYFICIKKEDIKMLDLIVCGSDQIWNPLLTKGLDPHYFGIIDESYHIKSIAYAASDGGNLEADQTDSINKYLNNLDSISVREKSMIQLIQKYYKGSISSVLDPVFLPDSSFWNAILSKRKYENYILIYQFHNDDIIKDAKKIAKQTGKKIIEITNGFPYRIMLKSTHKILASIGPEEFISLFVYADYILTNSFHGAAFSIIFNKQFCSYKKENDKGVARIADLLSEFDLTERYVDHADEVIFKKIDYLAVNRIREQKCLASFHFLNEVISTFQNI
jgi:hypothetical protein